MATDETIDNMIEMLTLLTLGKQPAKLAALARVWRIVFSDVTDEELAQAVHGFISTDARFWPPPGAIKSMVPRLAAEQLLAETSEDEAAAMWGVARNWARRGGDCRDRRDQEPDWHNPKHRENPRGGDEPITNPDAFAAAVRAVGWMGMVSAQDDRLAQTNGNTFRKAYNYHRKRKAAGDLQLSSKDAGKVLSMIGAKRLEKKK